MHQIPVVDLSQYRDRSLSPSQRAELVVACEDHGFFVLVGHGCEALVERVFSQSALFFAAPKESKMKVFRNAENPLGYYDRELTKQKRDQKEVFDFKAGGYVSANPARQSRWPEMFDAQGADLFRNTLTDFFVQFTTLAHETMAMVFDTLGMPKAEIERTMADGFGDNHSSAGRLNYYPAQDPVPATDRRALNKLGDMALHHHTDPGAITLLLQDDHGGLQAQSKTQGWIDVPPRAGAIVVNIGDVLQVWTNDRCTAGIHRVLPVHSIVGRYSVPFFYQPRFDAKVTPWVKAGDTAHYQPFAWRDYIRGRVMDNFADYGEIDIQIEKYRVA